MGRTHRSGIPTPASLVPRTGASRPARSPQPSGSGHHGRGGPARASAAGAGSPAKIGGSADARRARRPRVTAEPARAGSGPGPPGPRRRTRSARCPRRAPPLTNVPFVLPRSSTYQVRPRNVRIACSCGGERVVDDDRVVDVAARAGHRVERRTPRPRAARRPGEATTTQPTELARVRAPPRAGRGPAPGRRRTGTGRGARGTAAAAARGWPRRRPRSGGRAADSTTRTVSPSSIRSPSPSTTSPTRVPFTRDPLVLRSR